MYTGTVANPDTSGKWFVYKSRESGQFNHFVLTVIPQFIFVPWASLWGKPFLERYKRIELSHKIDLTIA
jgi:hypothetical protein